MAWRLTQTAISQAKHARLACRFCTATSSMGSVRYSTCREGTGRTEKCKNKERMTVHRWAPSGAAPAG